MEVAGTGRQTISLSLLSLVLLVMTGCVSTPELLQSSGDRASLLAESLDGRAALGRRYRPEELPDFDILELDEEMTDFVESYVLPYRSKTSRLSHLLHAILSPGLLGLQYGEQHTKTAKGAFDAQRANCLAFSNLFVALARASGLKASFHDVLVSPEWELMEGSMTLRRHVNVQIQMSRRFLRVVDISPNRSSLVQLESTELSDEQAFAQFYNNLAIDYLHAKNYRSAYLYVRKALLLDPKAAFIWSNLGVILSRFNLLDHAEAVLLQARELDPAEHAAMINLLSLYRAENNAERVAYYEQQLAHYQNRNPYYLLLLARKAYFEKDFEETLKLVNRALARKPEEELMYELKARAHIERQEMQQAQKALKQAIQYAKSVSQKEEYESRLEQLDAVTTTEDG